MPLSALLEALRAGRTHESFDRSRAVLMAVMDFVVCVAADAGVAEGGAVARDEEGGEAEEEPGIVPEEEGGEEPGGAPVVRHMMLTREPEQECGDVCHVQHNGRTLQFAVPVGVDVGERFRVKIPATGGVAAQDTAPESSEEEEGHDEEARRHERERCAAAEEDGSAEDEDGPGEGSGVFWYNDCQ